MDNSKKWWYSTKGLLASFLVLAFVVAGSSQAQAQEVRSLQIGGTLFQLHENTNSRGLSYTDEGLGFQVLGHEGSFDEDRLSYGVSLDYTKFGEIHIAYEASYNWILAEREKFNVSWRAGFTAHRFLRKIQPFSPDAGTGNLHIGADVFFPFKEKEGVVIGVKYDFPYNVGGGRQLEVKNFAISAGYVFAF